MTIMFKDHRLQSHSGNAGVDEYLYSYVANGINLELSESQESCSSTDGVIEVLRPRVFPLDEMGSTVPVEGQVAYYREGTSILTRTKES